MGNLAEQLGKAQENFLKSFLIHAFLAPDALKHGGQADFGKHIFGLNRGKRCQVKNHVLEDFHVDPAQRHCEDRAEDRITDHPDHHFHAGGYHFLHQYGYHLCVLQIGQEKSNNYKK